MASKTPTLVPSRTALLIMDFQDSLLEGVPEPDRLLERAQRAQRAALAAGVLEIHVRVAFTPQDHAAVPAHNKVFAPLAKAAALAEGSPDTEVHHLLRKSGRALTITKNRVSAFSTTALHQLLQEQGIDTLVLAGVFTRGVVLSTVRDAADRDYRLFVLRDVCADGDPQLHEMLMRSVIPMHADILDLSAFEAAIRLASQSPQHADDDPAPTGALPADPMQSDPEAASAV
ncbi:pyrazinamidase [Streptomyces viridiviolaceus]|uniref:Cysteine hydrolase family protein n=1 Tax=Streptomyces viridiviolaceus TaxID=68282 RepID=A0ABW2ED11_9ACTN|nr:isochorismatase family cysteine hydrolase [Streptomyces viridiviolaceus]GHB67699.1 pyrazinamidase [Streptomyces viridiviolaceus]